MTVTEIIHALELQVAALRERKKRLLKTNKKVRQQWGAALDRARNAETENARLVLAGWSLYEALGHSAEEQIEAMRAWCEARGIERPSRAPSNDPESPERSRP